jgi:hypothetical protein
VSETDENDTDETGTSEIKEIRGHALENIDSYLSDQDFRAQIICAVVYLGDVIAENSVRIKIQLDDDETDEKAEERGVIANDDRVVLERVHATLDRIARMEPGMGRDEIRQGAYDSAVLLRRLLKEVD